MKERTLNAMVSRDWAMLPDYLEWMSGLALELASLDTRERQGRLRAVEAERGEPLEYAYRATIRDGVAILPVTGPISRYMSFFSAYSGGTSVAVLARDFNACLNDPRVDSILFEFNSPGGEVTGVSELARMIYAARGRKPMTARVGGMCCSAAYWLGAACGDIVIDDTAPLGSIGVYTTFLDTKKADQKAGYREIRIISDDSPDKCPDPTTPRGEQLVRDRLNAIMGVFVASVAEFRDVTPERVRADFGKGDVRVGQAAIDAGLADRLGSFEETLAELVEAHGRRVGRGYTGALHASEEEPEACPDHPEGCPDECPFTGDEDEASARAGAEVSPAAAGAAAAASTGADNHTREEAEDMSEQTNAAAGAGQADAAEQTETVEQLRAQLAEQTRLREEAEARAAAAGQTAEQLAEQAKAAAQRARLAELAKDFHGDVDAKVGLLVKMAATFGEDSDELKAYVADQNALAAQVRAGGVFGENGSSRSSATDPAGTALAKLNKLAADKAAADGITIEAAFSAVAGENQELYAQYHAEQSR